MFFVGLSIILLHCFAFVNAWYYQLQHRQNIETHVSQGIGSWNVENHTFLGVKFVTHIKQTYGSNIQKKTDMRNACKRQ